MKLFRGPRRKLAIVATAVVATVVVGGGAALAAMLITGQGTASAESYQGQNLTVSASQVNKPIWPGVIADLSFNVKNDNPFPVTVTKVGIDTSKPTDIKVKCDKAGEEKLLRGPAGADLNALSVTLAEPVTVPANGATRSVVVPGAIQLDEKATKGCAVSVPFVVTGAGAGN